MFDLRRPAAGPEAYADDVEPQMVVWRGLVLAEPGPGQSPDLHLLAWAHRQDWTFRPRRCSCAHRLDLDEGEGVAVEDDYVDLPEAGSAVACDDREAESRKVPAGEFLADSAE